MTKEAYWDNWVIRTALTWEDIEFIFRKTGIDFVDVGYRHLVEELLEMNKLLSLITMGCVDLKVINKQIELFERLFQYTKSFYKEEEELIRKYQLPGLERQRKDHKRILTILYGTIQDFKGGKMKAINNFSTLILKVISNHLKGHDKETWGIAGWKRTIANAKALEDFEDSIRKMGIRAFDNEHQQFINLALSLRSQKSLEEIKLKLDDIYQNADQHFKKEEEFIRKFHTDNLDHIARDHKSVLSYILQSKEDNNLEDPENLVEISTEIILRWLVHVNETNYETICLANCSDKIFQNAKSIDDIDFTRQNTGVSSIDEKYHDLLETVFQMDDLIGETAEKDGEIIRNTAVEDLFNGMIQKANELFSVELDILKFEAGLHKDRDEEHRLHLAEHKKFLQIASYFHTSFHEDRIVISANMKARLLSFLVTHHNNFDIPAYMED